MPKNIQQLKKDFENIQNQAHEAKSSNNFRHIAIQLNNFAAECEQSLSQCTYKADLDWLHERIVKSLQQTLNYTYALTHDLSTSELTLLEKATFRLGNYFVRQGLLIEANEVYSDAQARGLLNNGKAAGKLFYKLAYVDLCSASKFLTSIAQQTINEQKNEEPNSQESVSLAEILESAMNNETIMLSKTEEKPIQENTEKTEEIAKNKIVIQQAFKNLEKSAKAQYAKAACLLARIYDSMYSFTNENYADDEISAALAFAVENQLFYLRASHLLQYLKTTERTTLFIALITYIQKQYIAALTYNATNNEVLQRFYFLIDNRGFPVNLKINTTDLFGYIYTNDTLPNDLKMSLVKVLFSRGFNSPLKQIFKDEFFYSNNSEAALVNQAYQSNNSNVNVSDLTQITTQYLAVSTSRGNNHEFFNATNNNKRKVTEVKKDDANKRNKNNENTHSQTLSLPQTIFSQNSTILSQSVSTASTQVEPEDGIEAANDQFTLNM